MKKSTKRKEKAPSHPATQRLTLETFKYPSCLKEGRRGTQERRSRKNSHPLRNASQAVFLFSTATTLARRWDTEQNSTSAKLGRVQRAHTAYPRTTFSSQRKTHSQICNISKDTIQEAFILKLRKMLCQVIMT